MKVIQHDFWISLFGLFGFFSFGQLLVSPCVVGGGGRTKGLYHQLSYNSFVISYKTNQLLGNNRVQTLKQKVQKFMYIQCRVERVQGLAIEHSHIKPKKKYITNYIITSICVFTIPNQSREKKNIQLSASLQMFVYLPNLTRIGCQSPPPIAREVLIQTKLVSSPFFFFFLVSLVEIGQNVTSLFTTTCNYQLFTTTFGHFCNYFLCWSYLQLHYNQFATILVFILPCEQHLVWFSSKQNNLCPISYKCD